MECGCQGHLLSPTLLISQEEENCARAAALQKLILFKRMLSIVGGYDVQTS
jgi:hypothetical protein